jgi:hypothetical protein
MARWLLLQLNHGKYPELDAHLFSEQQSREIWSPQTIIPTGDRPGPLAALNTIFPLTVWDGFCGTITGTNWLVTGEAFSDLSRR